MIMYTGSFFLYIYYKFKGDKITFSNILNEDNKNTKLKKYRYKAFFLGILFYVLLVIIIAYKYQ